MLVSKYWAAAHRLGVNYHQVPVNKPLNEVTHYHRDGGIRTDGNGGSGYNYHPNSFDEVGESEDGKLPPYALVGAMNRFNHRGDEDYYTQAGDLYRLMSKEQRTLLVDNIVGAMKSVPSFIQERQIVHFKKADKEYGERVEKGLAAARPGDSKQVPVTK